jgi:hypothetical protein
MRRRRAILFAALALAAPVPAFALVGGSSGVGSLDAHASLDRCGVFQQQIVCKFDVSFNEIAGAERYTASVTAPDGSVSDYGSVGPGGGSLWVPYAGDGSYTVTVDAWGEPPKEGKPAELVATDDANAGGATAPQSASGGSGAATDRGSQPAAQPDTTTTGDSSTPGPDPAAGDGETATTTTTTTTTTTPCVPPPPSPAPADPASDPGSGDASTLGGDAASSDAPAAEPDSATTPQCPDGTAAVDGDCCPQPSGP